MAGVGPFGLLVAFAVRGLRLDSPFGKATIVLGVAAVALGACSAPAQCHLAVTPSR